MRVLFPEAIFCAAAVLIGAPAMASAYSDVARGIDAINRGEAETAKRLFTAALEAPGLAPAYRPMAHLGRARVYLHERRCKDAESELSTALSLKPDYIDAYNLRAQSHACQARYNKALEDATAAIRLKPAAGYLYTRSRLAWQQGAFASAYDDAVAAAKADPGNLYFVLWQSVTALRIGKTEFPPQAPPLWPGPVLLLYRGEVSADAVLAAAGRDKDRICEADFYIGQWRLAEGRKDEARSHLLKAEGECPRDFVAFEAAAAELGRLP